MRSLIDYEGRAYEMNSAGTALEMFHKCNCEVIVCKYRVRLKGSTDC